MKEKDKKEIIIKVAEELFAQNGFSGTSVREIAKQADVNVAMISYYFGSKEKLLEAILHFRSDYLNDQIETIIQNDHLTIWEKLDQIIDSYVLRFVQNQPLHRILLREHGFNGSSTLGAFITKRKLIHYEVIVKFINQGQKNGFFRNDIDVLMLYTLLPGVTKHMLFNEEFMRQIIEAEQGKTIDDTIVIDRTRAYLKRLFKKILEIN